MYRDLVRKCIIIVIAIIIIIPACCITTPLRLHVSKGRMIGSGCSIPHDV